MSNEIPDADDGLDAGLYDYLNLVDAFAIPDELVELNLSLVRWQAHGPDNTMPKP